MYTTDNVRIKNKIRVSDIDVLWDAQFIFELMLKGKLEKDSPLYVYAEKKFSETEKLHTYVHLFINYSIAAYFECLENGRN